MGDHDSRPSAGVPNARAFGTGSGKASLDRGVTRPLPMALLRDVATDPLSLEGGGARRVREVLSELEERLHGRPEPAFVRVPSDRPVLVLGDTHGDVPSILRAVERARGVRPAARIVALGDYIDRATRREPRPAVLPNGSLWGFLLLLATKALDPEGIVLLQGNHEAQRRLPVPGPTFLRELRELFPRAEAIEIWDRALGLAERLPLAAATDGGVFLAHGGIPPAGRWAPDRWDRGDLPLLEGLLWADPDVDYSDRGAGFAFAREEMDEFLASIGCSVFVRGHDPEHLGTALFGERLVTLQTSDIFQFLGRKGILVAEIPPRARIRTARDLSVYALSGRGWEPYELAPAVTP